MDELEIENQLRRYNSGQDEPPYQGARPDMSKLQASTQANREEWWGESLCDLCIYQADIFSEGVYYCLAHWDLFTGKNPS